MSPDGRFSVVVIDSDAGSLNKIVKCIKDLGNHVEVGGSATAFEAGFELIHRCHPRIVILELTHDMELSRQRIKTVLERFPHVSIFATCDDKSSETILNVMRAGADEYILRPVTDEDLKSAIMKHGRLWVSRPEMGVETGTVLTCFSPKGGVGVTTIAINAATHIYAATNKPTLLVDLDLSAGDVTTFLNLKPSYTISDVTLNMSRLDRSFLQGVITRHESGVHILAEPQKVEEAVSIMGVDIKKVLSLLKTMFSYIVIDTETAMNERTMATIEMADMVWLIFFMSLPGIKNIQRHLHYLDAKNFDRDKLRLVVNRYIKKGDIRIEDAEKALDCPIFWSIPNDYDAAMSCLNKGLPLSMCSPRSRVNTSIRDLAKTLVEKK